MYPLWYADMEKTKSFTKWSSLMVLFITNKFFSMWNLLFFPQQIQVLDVQETIDRQQGKEYEHDLSETEKAIVREMCNVSLMCFVVYSVLKASLQLSYCFMNTYFLKCWSNAFIFLFEKKTKSLCSYL